MYGFCPKTIAQDKQQCDITLIDRDGGILLYIAIQSPNRGSFTAPRIVRVKTQFLGNNSSPARATAQVSVDTANREMVPWRFAE